MIVVTGASGRLGRSIVERLLERRRDTNVGVSVRDPDKVRDLAERGVRVRQGDFAEPESLEAAFEGASRLLLVSSNAGASGGDPLAQHRAAIAAARGAGVRRIVYTSHMAASPTSAFPPMRDHAATEKMLAESGVAWTSLRNGFYAATVPMLIGAALTSGVVAAPVDGAVSWTAHRDLAEAAATLLLSEAPLDGPTPPLTAASALDLGDIAALLSDMRGEPVVRVIVSDEEHARGMSERGVPPAAIETTLALFRAARAGEFAAVAPTLSNLIGREPTSLREVLAASSGPAA